MFIEKYVCAKSHLKWLLCQWVTWPFMCPLAWGCLLLFYKIDQSYHITKFRYSTPSDSLYCLRVYCCFTLFTTKFTIIIVVCSLKNMRIPSLVLIGCCVSYMAIYVRPIIMYCLRLLIVVLQELLYRNVTFLFRGHYGAYKFLNSVWLLRYASWNWRRFYNHGDITHPSLDRSLVPVIRNY